MKNELQDEEEFIKFVKDFKFPPKEENEVKLEEDKEEKVLQIICHVHN